ncbi:4'-phosphopantetheinyl transferase superfamily protein [Nonomuraea harbinensis]|uniref:4'-phosphopantetheinyl transferase superfamily protein n=2 Tax=Nonomuraea TaxID=83681 RepID=A0ABW1C8T6_9ACTN|nr:4'-phosphopantetheinyl transferase superfamily protein [Nonomuraea harbinensis]
MSAGAALMGVDIVEVDRIARAARRGGDVFARRLTTAAERALGPGPAAFSVKESLIKAVGSRPPGFTWHDFEAEARPPSGWSASLLEEAAGELAASTGLRLTGGAAYTVRGASGRAALARLRPAPDGAGRTAAGAAAGAARRRSGDGGIVAGAARWGSGDGLFVSLAIVFVDGSVG